MNFTSSVHPTAYAPGFWLRIRLVTGLRPGAEPQDAGATFVIAHSRYPEIGSRLGARGFHCGNRAAALTSGPASRRATADGAKRPEPAEPTRAQSAGARPSTFLIYRTDMITMWMAIRRGAG